jgi:general secretion pathway protein C
MIHIMRVRWDAPVWVAGVLAVALGLQLAWALAVQVGVLDPNVESDAPISALPAAAPLPQVAQIMAAGLFGTREAATAGDPLEAPPTSLNLVLAGVLAARTPTEGKAIIGETTATAKLYGVGASLPVGARLHSVYPHRVILDRNGALESLRLPAQSTAVLGIPTTASAPATNDAALSAISNVIRWQTVIRAGKPGGVRVYPGNDAAQFTAIGLRPGDLVLAINDTPLTDQANSEQFMRTLSGSPQSKLTVERNGREENVILNVAGLATPSATPPPPPSPAQDAQSNAQ